MLRHQFDCSCVKLSNSPRNTRGTLSRSPVMLCSVFASWLATIPRQVNSRGEWNINCFAKPLNALNGRKQILRDVQRTKKQQTEKQQCPPIIRILIVLACAYAAVAGAQLSKRPNLMYVS